MSKLNEPSQDWGGKWTEIKLRAFESYVNAYLTIMNAQKKKYNGWPITIYFDGFAGSGQRGISRSNDEELFLNAISDEELSVYKGSVERVLAMENTFNEYYFVDNDEDTIKILQETLKEKNLVTESCNFICNDINDEIVKFASEKLTRQTSALCYGSDGK